MNVLSKLSGYPELLNDIGTLLENARKKAYVQINTLLVKTYWEIGRRIVVYERENNENAAYGSKIFEQLADDLRKGYGKGFSRSNVIYMRLFALKYPKSQTLSDQLSWSHYVELLMVDDDIERSFYEKQSLLEKWSLRELKRQKSSALFQRLALSKDKKGILKLAKKGYFPQKPSEVVKEPYVLEFLGIPENYKLSEKEFEQKVIDNLQNFLLELGKGFSFVARQYRITLGNRHFYVDLVFYHRILKCFVLIDLKRSDINHQDIGQMNLYLNYFKREEVTEGDNEPIGIILTKEKEEVVVEYALGGISNKLFVSKYKLYLPEKQILQEQVQKILKEEKE